MRLQRQFNQQIVTLDLASTLGHGGEARIYAVPHDETLVAKIYHQPKEEHVQKLLAMLANPPENPILAGKEHIAIAWPVDLLRTTDNSQRVVGFLMPRVNQMNSIVDFYNPRTRRQKCPFFNYLYLHRTARNLAAAVGALHTRGYCIGDVNESNILVGNTALVTLVDTDSFQVPNSNRKVVYRCPVGKPEFTPPELQGKSFAQLDRTPEQDLFGLAVLIFQLLMEGTHPFAGIFQGKGEPPPYESRIASGHFVYSRGRNVPYLPTPIAPKFEILHPGLQQLFIRCFEDGHHNPQIRPNTQTWQAALKAAEKDLITCSANNQHRYGQHLPSCPWCERTIHLGRRDPFPSWQTVQKGQHLIPLKQHRATGQTGKLSNAHHSRVALKQLPLVFIPKKKHKKKFSIPLVAGLVTTGVLGLLPLALIFQELNLLPEFISIASFTSTPEVTPSENPNQNPGSVAYHDQGNVYYKLGDYPSAIENFNQALRLNPNDAKAYVNRGNARYEIAHHSGEPDRVYQAAISDFNHALRLNTQDAEAYVSRGIVRYEIAQYSKDDRQNYQAAIADFSKALHLNPNEANVYVKRGIVHHALAKVDGKSSQNYAKAIDDFNQALILNSQVGEAYLNRGLVRYELAESSGKLPKDYELAVDDLQQAAKIFLEQGNIEQYQQAVNTICLALDNDCNAILQNPEQFLITGSKPGQKISQPAN